MISEEVGLPAGWSQRDCGCQNQPEVHYYRLKRRREEKKEEEEEEEEEEEMISKY